MGLLAKLKSTVGALVGRNVGFRVVPSLVGAEVVGYFVGQEEGVDVGLEVLGLDVGCVDGWEVGWRLG